MRKNVILEVISTCPSFRDYHKWIQGQLIPSRKKLTMMQTDGHDFPSRVLTTVRGSSAPPDQNPWNRPGYDSRSPPFFDGNHLLDQFVASGGYASVLESIVQDEESIDVEINERDHHPLQSKSVAAERVNRPAEEWNHHEERALAVSAAMFTIGQSLPSSADKGVTTAPPVPSLNLKSVDGAEEAEPQIKAATLKAGIKCNTEIANVVSKPMKKRGRPPKCRSLEHFPQANDTTSKVDLGKSGRSTNPKQKMVKLSKGAAPKKTCKPRKVRPLKIWAPKGVKGTESIKNAKKANAAAETKLRKCKPSKKTPENVDQHDETICEEDFENVSKTCAKLKPKKGRPRKVSAPTKKVPELKNYDRLNKQSVVEAVVKNPNGTILERGSTLVSSMKQKESNTTLIEKRKPNPSEDANQGLKKPTASLKTHSGKAKVIVKPKREHVRAPQVRAPKRSLRIVDIAQAKRKRKSLAE